MTSIIARKRDGYSLAQNEWGEVIEAYTRGEVPDYQMAALLMAVYLNGMEPHELDALTDAMLRSGATLPSDGHPPWIDKHSTGGVGDKVSLVLAPLVASCGVLVPMMSGRGLGHTTGTLDKLEAIPGFRTDLSLAEARDQMERVGCVMMGATATIAPADRKLYALRDATATIGVIPLIAASIMSKKLAEGVAGLVLDVKHGDGAFLPNVDDGIELANTMIRIGEDHDCRTVALLTAMDRPLGRACGNALETEEALLALHGEGPEDLMEVTYALGVEMLLLGGAASTPSEARERLEQSIHSGRAADKFREIVVAQGASPHIVDDPAGLPQAAVESPFEAPHAGFVACVNPRTIGEGIVALGGGRRTMESELDFTAGFVISVKPGDAVERGEPIASVFARDAEQAELGLATLRSALEITEEDPPSGLPLISHRASADGVEYLT